MKLDEGFARLVGLLNRAGCPVGMGQSNEGIVECVEQWLDQRKPDQSSAVFRLLRVLVDAGCPINLDAMPGANVERVEAWLSKWPAQRRALANSMETVEALVKALQKAGCHTSAIDLAGPNGELVATVKRWLRDKVSFTEPLRCDHDKVYSGLHESATGRKRRWRCTKCGEVADEPVPDGSGAGKEGTVPMTDALLAQWEERASTGQPEAPRTVPVTCRHNKVYFADFEHRAAGPRRWQCSACGMPGTDWPEMIAASADQSAASSNPPPIEDVFLRIRKGLVGRTYNLDEVALRLTELELQRRTS